MPNVFEQPPTVDDLALEARRRKYLQIKTAEQGDTEFNRQPARHPHERTRLFDEALKIPTG